MHAFFPRLLLLLLFLPLTHCTYLPSLPYKIDIQQGNVVTDEMVAKLKPGMTRSQVRFTLGTPLVIDIFHGDRWDYIYRTAPGGRVAEEKKLTVFFQDDRLSHIQGDFPQPSAFSESEPAQNIFAPEQTFTPVPDTDNNMNEEPDKKGTIDFLKENQTNFYKDDQ